MLETSWVCGVTCDRNVNVFFPHDSNTFRNAVSAVAVNFCTKSLRVGFAEYFFNFVNCGFAGLKPDQEFDRFVIRFLRSTEPLDVLEEEVEKQVIQGRNFYLYKVYRDSYCHQKELLDYLM